MERMNYSSISIAKQTYLIESALSSLNKKSHKETKIDKYLPFRFNTTTKDNRLDQLTVDCFWELMEEDNLPEYVWRAFNDPELIEPLKAMKR